MVLDTQHLKKKSTFKFPFVWRHLVNIYFLCKLLSGLCTTIPEITTHFQIISGTTLHQTEFMFLLPLGGAVSESNSNSPAKSSQL